MTPEAQRIAIAEFCGWVWYRMPEEPGASRSYRCLFIPEIQEHEGQPECWTVRADMTENICNMDYMVREGLVPDYLNDLNAMHEAEMILPEGNGLHGRVVYNNILMQICGSHSACISAKAARRAEAYVRTIGKWRDE